VLIDVCGADDLAFFECFGIGFALFVARSVIIDSIDSDDWCLVAFLSDSQSASVLRYRHRGDTLRALDARIGFLSFVLQVVDDDVVTSRVDNLIVIEEKNVVRHVALKSRDELGL